MTTNFPGSLDDFQNPDPSTQTRSTNPQLRHAQQHQNHNDAIEAIESKVGITDSEDVDSLDWLTQAAYEYLDLQQLETEWPTMTRQQVSSTNITTGSGNLRIQYFTAARSGQSTGIRMECGSTAAAATPTLIRVGLYTANDAGDLLALAASTPNDTSLLASSSTTYTKSWSNPHTLTKGQRYALALLVVTATTVPTLCGKAPAQREMQRSPALCAVLTGQADLPASVLAGSLGSSVNHQYIVAT